MKSPEWSDSEEKMVESHPAAVMDRANQYSVWSNSPDTENAEIDNTEIEDTDKKSAPVSSEMDEQSYEQPSEVNDSGLSIEQSEFIGSEFRTEAGSAFFRADDERFRDAARDVPAYPGEYVLDVHGDANAVYLKDGDGNGDIQLNAHDFAEVVKSTSWDGQPVRLFSCNTGSSENGFGQELADELRVPVTAPNDVVSTMGNGEVSIGDISKDEFWQLPDGDHTSAPQWIEFTPRH